MGVPFVAKVEFTAKKSDLTFYVNHDGEMAGLDQSVSGVLEIGQQRDRFLEVIRDMTWRLLMVIWLSHPSASGPFGL